MKNLGKTFAVIIALCLFSFLFFGKLMETNKYYNIGLACVILFLLLRAIFSTPDTLDEPDEEPDDIVAFGSFEEKADAAPLHRKVS